MMETPTINKFQMMAVAATATVLLIAGLAENKQLTPSEIHDLNMDHDKKSWDEYTHTPYYTIMQNDQTIKQIMTIHKFASNLISKSENLDPSIAKIINKNFSKLL